MCFYRCGRFRDGQLSTGASIHHLSLDLVRETSAVSGPVAENPGLLSEVTTELTDPKKPFIFIWLRVVSAASPTDYVAMVFWPFTARLVGKTCVSCLNSKLFAQRYTCDWLVVARIRQWPTLRYRCSHELTWCLFLWWFCTGCFRSKLAVRKHLRHSTLET